MIYEREVHFSKDDLERPDYFPKILIIRKKKIVESLEKNESQRNWSETLKNLLKVSQEAVVDKIQLKLRE